ncbi:MAG TPA: hypothetical protein VGX68_12410 [Thermoanaerobaculia bacterium]|jgi:hypothetical protein|nr:hypothetical protein [Thermoanaerobaculia bacterium]
MNAPIEESPDERLRSAWLVAAAFVLLTVPRLLLHELWRDEAWLWLVVTESRSLPDLFAPLSRSGQGYLFPLLCFLARQVSTSTRAMQLVHLVLAAGAVFVFTRWAPFPRLERALFVLGYFFFYEYAVISRHYAAGALLLWLACAAARTSRPALALGAALGLLCQTTVYGYILALAVASGWLLDRRLRRNELAPISRTDAAAGLALALAGAAAGLIQLIPEPGTSFAPGWRFAWDPMHAGKVLRMSWQAFVPLPRPGLHFWNTNLLDAWPSLQAVAGLLTLALAVALLWRRKVALTTFGLGAAGLLAFGYLKLVGALRHTGHFWLLFAAALWLGGGHASEDGRGSWRNRTLLILLVLQAVAGAYASWMDLRHPFSNGGATAELIRRERLDRYPLLGYREPPAATVALALGRPLYFPSRGVFTTYPDWGPKQRELDDRALRCAARELARREGRDIILIINRELPMWGELTAVGVRSGAIVVTEDYHLYRLHHHLLSATAQAAQCPSASRGETTTSFRHNTASFGGSSGSSIDHLRRESIGHLSRDERATEGRPGHRPRPLRSGAG